jgi:hypothetical protein
LKQKFCMKGAGHKKPHNVFKWSIQNKHRYRSKKLDYRFLGLCVGSQLNTRAKRELSR